MKKHFNQQKLGILGGGQLGRMFIQEAVNLDVEVHILDPDPKAPCHLLASSFTCGSLKDFETVMNFGKDLDVLTIEIEQVNAEALAELQIKGVAVYPRPENISLIQDKRLQKQFYRDKGLPTADFLLIEKAEEIGRHLDFLPAFQKAGRDGYDGRGVQYLGSEADLSKALQVPGLLEKAVNIDKEISIIIARSPSGEIKAFPPAEMVYVPEQNLVDFLFFPADIPAETAAEAIKLATRIVQELDFTGLLAVEMFVDKQQKLLVNEMAPRPHNSGHHTIEAFYTSQYAQHLRAILDLPLGGTRPKMPVAAMVNLLGEPGANGPAVYQGMDEILKMEGVYPHLYGKKMVKPFRKMGHVTIIGTEAQEVVARAHRVKETCKVVAG